MAYRSWVAIITPEDEFKQLYKEMKDRDYLQLLEIANNYKTEIWKEKEWDSENKKIIFTGKEKRLTLIEWDWLKAYGKDWDYLTKFIEEHSGLICRIGEESGDVENEWFTDDENEIDWFDFMEAVSYIEFKTKPGGTSDMNKFMEEICS